MLSVLGQLDLVDEATVGALAAYARPPVLGGGQPVGAIEPLVELQRP
jgi:hypothetical protein